MKKSARLLTSLSLALLAVGLGACAGDDDAPGASKPGTSSAASGNPFDLGGDVPTAITPSPEWPSGETVSTTAFCGKLTTFGTDLNALLDSPDQTAVLDVLHSFGREMLAYGTPGSMPQDGAAEWMTFMELFSTATLDDLESGEAFAAIDGDGMGGWIADNCGDFLDPPATDGTNSDTATPSPDAVPSGPSTSLEDALEELDKATQELDELLASMSASP